MSLAGKKTIPEKVKSIWIRSMKAVGNAAASIANNTRYKVDEVTIQNRRREVLNDIAHKAYALWLKGGEFPEPMVKMLDELKQLDEQLNDMRAEKYAARISQQAETENTPKRDSSNSDTEAVDEDDYTVPSTAEDSPVSDEINELFDSQSSVGKSAQKVNSVLDQMSERIRNFPGKGSEEEKKGNDLT